MWFRERVPDAVYVATAADAIQALTQQNFRVVFLDHDLRWMNAADNAIVKGTGKEVECVMPLRWSIPVLRHGFVPVYLLSRGSNPSLVLAVPALTL